MKRVAALALVLATALTNGACARPPGADLGMTIYLQRQALARSVYYSDVRAAVEDGRRPAGDLETALRSLKAAQVALYDELDATHRSNAAFYDDLRKQNAKRLKQALIEVRTQEAELPALADADRPNAEARLRLGRQVIEGYQENAGRLAPRVQPPRPRLPILPPRS